MIQKFRLSDIEIGRYLGKGRFGNVYMIRDKQTQLLAAMKVIDKKILKDSRMED